ncbi:MAG: hypothetical protein ACLRMJ_13795 [Alistipes finegoldii]
MNGYNDPRRPLYFTTNVRHLVKKTAEPTGEKDQNNEDIYNESDILIRKGAQYIGVPVGCGWAIRTAQRQPARLLLVSGRRICDAAAHHVRRRRLVPARRSQTSLDRRRAAERKGTL